MEYRRDFDGQLYDGKYIVKIWHKYWLFGLFWTWYGELYYPKLSFPVFSCKKSGIVTSEIHPDEYTYVYRKLQDAAEIYNRPIYIYDNWA